MSTSRRRRRLRRKTESGTKFTETAFAPVRKYGRKLRRRKARVGDLLFHPLFQEFVREKEITRVGKRESVCVCMDGRKGLGVWPYSL